ncbi:phosphopantetheine-binding protein [Streptomyces sulphureus]|uniref:phosphopantetheine-binding protein n=1 Tax=Streptomyces sulphureus TaxID=47758 RepID=UPI00037C8616|nr:phosphopantetheine-binding protein [Streptomyces sulphureus]
MQEQRGAVGTEKSESGDDGLDRVYRQVLRTHLREDTGELPYSGRLVDLGIDSLATVQLLIDVEEAFGIFFPDELVTAKTFNTIGSLRSVIETLVDEKGRERGDSA